MIDVSTKYMGLKLNGPIVVSSTPLSESLENVRRMEDAGASAIVLTSLFEAQLALESRALDEDLSLATDRSQTSAELESRLLELVETVCKAVKVPVSVKLSPSYTSIPHIAAQLE